MGVHFSLLMDAGRMDLIACVAALGRSLKEKFDPQRFLAEFSSRAQPLIPHDRMVIACVEDEGRTCTVLAEDPGQGPLLHQGRYTTDFDPGGRYMPEQLGLRERGDDVLLLAGSFIRELGARMGKGDAGLNRQAQELLLAHQWPGNIRELQNAIERALIISNGGLLTADQLGITVKRAHPDEARATAASSGMMPETAALTPSAAEPLAELEKRAIAEALRRARGNKSRAAGALGLSRTQLYTRLKRFGLDL